MEPADTLQRLPEYLFGSDRLIRALLSAWGGQNGESRV